MPRIDDVVARLHLPAGAMQLKSVGLAHNRRDGAPWYHRRARLQDPIEQTLMKFAGMEGRMGPVDHPSVIQVAAQLSPLLRRRYHLAIDFDALGLRLHLAHQGGECGRMMGSVISA